MVQEAQVASMIAATLSGIPEPLDTLRHCRWLFKRHVNTRMILNDVWSSSPLNKWSMCPHSSLLIIVGSIGLRAETRGTATRMIDLVRAVKNVPVLWALNGAQRSNIVRSTTAILKYLAMQALKLEAEAISGQISRQFNVTSVAKATTEDDWLHILEVALALVPLTYIVIDCEVLGPAAEDKVELMEFITLLERYIGRKSTTTVKVVVLNWRRAAVDAALLSLRPSLATYVLQLDTLARRAKGSPAVARGGRNHSRSSFQSSLASRQQKFRGLGT